MNEATRVRYESVDMIAESLRNYIKLHTKDGIYIGNLCYLEIARQHENKMKSILEINS